MPTWTTRELIEENGEPLRYWEREKAAGNIIGKMKIYQVTSPHTQEQVATGIEWSAADNPFELADNTNIPHFITRIGSSIPFHIKQSDSAQGKGKAFFALNPVDAWTTIFRVKKPLLSIINSEDNNLEAICDNDFRIQKTTSQLPLPPLPHSDYFNENVTSNASDGIDMRDIILSACKGCKVYHYCDKHCQKIAWKDHHKAECKALAEAFQTPNEVTEKLEKVSDIDHRQLRFMLRLSLMRANGFIADTDWNEVKRLPIEQEHMSKQVDWDDTILKRLMKLASQAAGIPISEDYWYDGINLYCLMRQNERSLQTPLFGGQRTVMPKLPSAYEVGVTLEPFISMITHSCNPNSRIIFEGKELRVRTLRDIAENEEISVDWVTRFGPNVRCRAPTADIWAWDPEKSTAASKYAYSRREFLHKLYNIYCNCDLCLSNGNGSPNPLAVEASELTKSLEYGLSPLTHDTPNKLPDIERIIAGMKSNGFGWDAPQMRSLYKMAFLFNFREGNLPEAFKICLQLRYLIEPNQNPPTPLDDRLDTLHALINTLVYQRSDNLYLALPTKKLFMSFKVGMFFILAKETAVCFGEDTHAAVYQKATFNQSMVEFKVRSPDRSEYIQLEYSGNQRTRFKKCLNKYLEWAGIPTVSEKEALWALDFPIDS